MVICSILETSPERTEQRLALAPPGCRLVEIRCDHLRSGDIERLVRRSGRPVVVTIRTVRDGGGFDGSEEERRGGLRAALNAGARYVDVELDGPLAEMAGGPDARRVILSHHGAKCTSAELVPLYRRLASRSAAVLKLVPHADAAGEVGAVREVLAIAARDSRRLTCFALGRAGAISRLLAPSWGAWATYGSVSAGSETAPGQFTAYDLLGLYDVLNITPRTRRFALIGSEVFGSPSPAMHRAGYLDAGIDARYFPIEIDRLDECLPLLGAQGVAGIEALAVTMPFKEEAATRCVRHDPVAKAAGAVNTVVVEDDGWSGFNTDGPAIVERVRSHLDPKGCEVAVIGAGGTARAAAAVLRDAGAKVTLYNRSPARVRSAADRLGVDAKPLDRLSDAGWDVLVQATPLGGAGERVLAADRLGGRLVVDAVYGVETPLLADARSRGLAAVDGLELLVAQAVGQFERMNGCRPSEEVLDRAARGWLARRAS